MASARMAPVIGLKAMLRVLLAADTMKSPIGKRRNYPPKQWVFQSPGLPRTPEKRVLTSCRAGFLRRERGQCASSDSAFTPRRHAAPDRTPSADRPSAEALPAAIARQLGLVPAELEEFTVFKRGYDARKPERLSFIYTIDVTVKNEGRC